MIFKDFCEKYCVNICKFARKAGVTTPTIYRVFDGTPITYKSALAISTTTDGLVGMEEILHMPKN